MDICLKQGHPDVAQGLFDIGFGKLAGAPHAAEYAIEFFRK